MADDLNCLNSKKLNKIDTSYNELRTSCLENSSKISSLAKCQMSSSYHQSAKLQNLKLKSILILILYLMPLALTNPTGNSVATNKFDEIKNLKPKSIGNKLHELSKQSFSEEMNDNEKYSLKQLKQPKILYDVCNELMAQAIPARSNNNDNLNLFKMANKNGIRYKKSPFDDEGIRYKKSPFDDEGIRFKKSPFDDEGIRYKKSPFDDEGIRYKKSPFDDEGIRYKKRSPFDDEGIRYKKSPFDDEGIRY